MQMIMYPLNDMAILSVNSQQTPTTVDPTPEKLTT